MTIDMEKLAPLANERWFYDEATRTVLAQNRASVATIHHSGNEGLEDGRLTAAAPRLLAAVLVFCTDRRIRASLEARDPKALEQARLAVIAARIGKDDTTLTKEHHHG